MSSIAYFGEPVCSCSLKQGRRDGFLAPCTVVEVHIGRDVEGYQPEQGQLHREGKVAKVHVVPASLARVTRLSVICHETEQFLVAGESPAGLRPPDDVASTAVESVNIAVRDLVVP